jgi:thiol-disulfide isomerase/thioredoxin
MKNALIFIVITALAGGAGFGLQHYLSKQEVQYKEPVNTAVGQSRPEFAMKDLDGVVRNIKEWDGKIVLVNFWATWCPPCLKEMPYFVELQKQYGDQGFQIIGIAIDDEDAVRVFVDDMGINYPIMAGEIDTIELSRRYGNQIGGLPYSVVINRQGEITDTIMGELDKIKAEKILKKLGLKV